MILNDSFARRVRSRGVSVGHTITTKITASTFLAGGDTKNTYNQFHPQCATRVNSRRELSRKSQTSDTSTAT